MLTIKGNVGAYGTVTKWTDFNTNVVYHGFPYVSWVKGQNPVLKTVQVPLHSENDKCSAK